MASVTARYESDARAVRRPGGGAVRPGSIRDLRHPRAVGVHHVYAPVAMAVRVESDKRAIRRPDGVAVGGEAVGESGDPGAVGVHHVYLSVAAAAG